MNNLYDKLIKIGFRVNSEEEIKEFVDIEKTLLDVLYEVDHDSRLLGLIFSWANVHGEHILAEKFLKYYETGIEYRGECPWVSALCAHLVHLKKHKFKKGIKKFKEEVWIGNRVMRTALQMDGAIEYLKEINVMISKKHLRIREDDVLSSRELIQINVQYRNRFIYGTNWRSEIITAIERGLENPYRISKELKIGYSRVWAVFNEYQMVKKLLSRGI